MGLRKRSQLIWSAPTSSSVSAVKHFCIWAMFKPQIASCRVRLKFCRCNLLTCRLHNSCTVSVQMPEGKNTCKYLYKDNLVTITITLGVNTLDLQSILHDFLFSCLYFLHDLANPWSLRASFYPSITFTRPKVFTAWHGLGIKHQHIV